jgi:uncharacterized protein
MSKEFFDFIKDGNMEEVQRLLALNPSLIHEKENGLSSVMIAAYYQEPAIAEFLAEKAVNLTIFEACAIGNTHQVILHLARDPMLVNAYADDGFQPLGLACFFGHLETAEYLVKAGASVNSPSRNDLAAAPIQSATAGNHAEIVSLLLANRADPNVREQSGFTPLHTAAQNGNLGIIRSLLYNGGDLDIRTPNGKLPLDMALEGGKTEAADLLKEGITRRFKAVKPKLGKI